MTDGWMKDTLLQLDEACGYKLSLGWMEAINCVRNAAFDLCRMFGYEAVSKAGQQAITENVRILMNELRAGQQSSALPRALRRICFALFDMAYDAPGEENAEAIRALCSRQAQTLRMLEAAQSCFEKLWKGLPEQVRQDEAREFAGQMAQMNMAFNDLLLLYRTGLRAQGIRYRSGSAQEIRKMDGSLPSPLDLRRMQDEMEAAEITVKKTLENFADSADMCT